MFGSVGFTDATHDEFVAEIRRLALAGEVSEVEDTRYGRKYTVRGSLRGPMGVIRVVTVWIEEPGQPGIRLVTVQPSE